MSGLDIALGIVLMIFAIAIIAVVLLQESRQAGLSGVIAGGAGRAVMEFASITDVLTKSMRTATAVNVVRATVDALKHLAQPEEIAARRGLALNEVAPDALLRARAAGIDEARKAREEAAKKAAEEKDGE